MYRWYTLQKNRSDVQEEYKKSSELVYQLWKDRQSFIDKAEFSRKSGFSVVWDSRIEACNLKHILWGIPNLSESGTTQIID